MKLLVDEFVPRKFKSSLPGHDCRTVPEQGLAGKKNGELLVLAEKSGSEVFLRLDRGLEYQQNLQGRNVAIILIRVQIEPPDRSVAMQFGSFATARLHPARRSYKDRLKGITARMRTSLIAGICLLLASFAFSQSQPQLNLMPMPASVQPGTGQLAINASFSVAATGSPDASFDGAVQRFATQLS